MKIENKEFMWKFTKIDILVYEADTNLVFKALALYC